MSRFVAVAPRSFAHLRVSVTAQGRAAQPRAFAHVVVRSFSATTDERPPFDKILVANRGEIACRVMRTCKRLGVKTVAIYSTPDANSLHVKMADEAVHVGPAASNQSYLNMEAILRAIKSTGAQAVHPGYGFLSENATFCKHLADNGIKFIGPNSGAIVSMGDKIQSKKLAKAANVNTIPGYVGLVETDEDVMRISNEIGYPVMIKASAGGGGKGMRVAWNDQDAVEGFRLSKDEAAASFGDDRMFIEKFIEAPRHIEIQVLADSFGNTIWLPERECSIQRRNQKVIEEAPSVFLDPETRRKMGEQAVMLSKAVSYESAGTVEFIVDPQRNFYFLEMNTRLQVEHPITEYITGVDLVEQMLKVASGKELTIKQEDVAIKGWAIESRVYAEDPTREFLPSIGVLSEYKEPEAPEGADDAVRIDTGVVEGSEISMFYDPMISKLCTYGADRTEAMDRMRDALDSYVIRGVRHNIPFLRSLIEHPRFVEGNLSTNFIAEEYPEGFKGNLITESATKELASVAACLQMMKRHRETGIDQQLSESTQVVVPEIYSVGFDGNFHEVEVVSELYGDFFDVHMVVVNGEEIPCSIDRAANSSLVRATVGERSFIMQTIKENTGGYTLQHNGSTIDITCMTPRERELYAHMPVRLAPDLSKVLLSPMPGAIHSIAVQVGDTVNAGQELAVVEAMKMQNILRAESNGVVKSVIASKGDVVAADDVLLELE